MASTTQDVRERQFNVRLSEEEAERLEVLETHYGLNGQAIVRMLLKRDHDRIAAELAEAKAAKKGKR